MQNHLRTKTFLTSLLINTGLFILFFILIYTRFGTTDDVEMQMVLSGQGVLQEPSAYLRYSHLLIGQVLSTLYTWFPDIPWYGSYLTMAHLTGMTAILYSILIMKPDKFRFMVFIFCFLLGETAMLQELQFTSSSIVLGTGATFLLSTAIVNTGDNRQKYWYSISFLLLMIVTMIRWDSFQLIVVLSTPLLLYGIFSNQQNRIRKLIFCTIILLSAYCVNKSHYLIQNQDPSWAEFNEYKHSLAAHDILDYRKPQYEWTEETSDDYFYKVGWEYEDYMLFRQWFFADSTVYGLKQFKAIQKTFQDCPYPQEHFEERGWQFFIETPMSDYIFYSFLFMSIVLMLIRGGRWTYILIGTSLILVIGILGSLFIFKHLPERVSYPIAFYLICLGALFITYDKEVMRKTKFFALFSIGIMAASNLKTVIRESSETAIDKMHWTAALDSLKAEPGQLYTGGGDFYMQKILTPFQNSNVPLLQDFNMLDFGHMSNSPSYYKQLKNFGIKNIHKESVLRDDLFFVHRKNSSFMMWYANFIHRHYNILIEFELIRSEEKVDIAVYRIREQIREEENSQGISLSNMHLHNIESKDPKKLKDPTIERGDFKEEETFYFTD